MRKVVVLTTDGESREDGNVFYSRYLIVESSSLSFNEPIFSEPGFLEPSPTVGMEAEDIIEALKALGYTVEEPEAVIMVSEWE